MKKENTIPEKQLESVLRKQTNWKNLWFYQKTVVLYQLTYVFTRRFLPAYGDRPVDQMVQAARSGKQNIVEGSADGVTSMEMEMKLLNVARSSIQELLEDYEDYLTSHRLTKWTPGHHRYEKMLSYCREHNYMTDYERYFEKWTDEEAANVAIQYYLYFYYLGKHTKFALTLLDRVRENRLGMSKIHLLLNSSTQARPFAHKK